tara:strand:+ start:1418 stop:1852 length:435 start_codon:yes stop_codon:yes gene_type:complete
MAFKNTTRAGKTHLKKSVCLMSIQIGALQSADYNDASNNYLVGYLPPGAIVTDAKVVTKVISDAGTGVTPITLGTTEGGTEIMSAGDSDAVGITGTFTGEFDTDTGKPVYMTLGAVVTTGDVRLLISYEEYDLNTGDMTVIDNI